MRDQVAVVPLKILHDTKNAAHQDQSAGDVDDVEVPSPRDAVAEGLGSRPLGDAVVEQNRRGDEEPEDQDLAKQARDDYLLSRLVQL